MRSGLIFPTVLVAEQDDRLRHSLVRSLQALNYLVLEAANGTEALNVVRLHSRPIQLMLTDGGVTGHTLATTLQKYRPDMCVLFFARHTGESAEDFRLSEELLAKIRGLLEPLRKRASEQVWQEGPSPGRRPETVEEA